MKIIIFYEKKNKTKKKKTTKQFSWIDSSLVWARNKLWLLLQYPQTPKTFSINVWAQQIHSLFDFYKQENFTYPFSNNFHLIFLQNSNLSSRQSVVRCGLWSGVFFLIAPFPDHCLLELCILFPYCKSQKNHINI